LDSPRITLYTVDSEVPHESAIDDKDILSVLFMLANITKPKRFVNYFVKIVNFFHIHQARKTIRNCSSGVTKS